MPENTKKRSKGVVLRFTGTILCPIDATVGKMAGTIDKKITQCVRKRKLLIGTVALNVSVPSHQHYSSLDFDLDLKIQPHCAGELHRLLVSAGNLASSTAVT